MLEALVKHAHAVGFATEPGFKRKLVRFAINLDHRGDFYATPLGDDGKGLYLVLPERTGTNSGGKSHYLAENLGIAVRMEKPKQEKGTQSKPAGLGVVTVRNSNFLSLLRDSAEKIEETDQTSSAALRKLEASLRSEEKLNSLILALDGLKAKSVDLAVFEVEGTVLCEENSILNWWRSFFRTEVDQAANKGKMKPGGWHSRFRCLASGELCEPQRRHPDIGGLNNYGGSNQPKLISFDKKAYTSYTLEEGTNAAVSPESSYAYREALTRLVQDGADLGGTVCAHWYSKPLASNAEDPLSWLTEPEETTRAAARLAAKALLDSIKAGTSPSPLHNEYHAMFLSGEPARVVIRGYEQGSFASLLESTQAWFEHVSIAGLSSPTAMLPKFNTVSLCQLAPKRGKQKDEDWKRPIKHLQMPLWLAALRNTSIPFESARKVLTLVRSDLGTGPTGELGLALTGHSDKNLIDFSGTKISVPLAYVRLTAQMGLLKAYVIRNTTQGFHMATHLNPDHPDPAYHAGRLMAVMAYVQFRALGDVNANIVQRFFPAASSTPNLVFARLVKLNRFHLAKLNANLGRAMERKLAYIWGQMNDSLPATFSFEQQTLFALGYYQQLAYDVPEWRKDAGTAYADLNEGDPS